MNQTRNWITMAACALLAVAVVSISNGGCRKTSHAGRATNIIDLVEANFRKEVLLASQPVLVDFWASWCPPCRALVPVLNGVAREYDGRAIIGAVDVDAVPALAQQYGITALPTVILFQNGKMMEQAVGLRSEKDYQRMLNQALIRSQTGSSNRASRGSSRL